MAAIFGSKDIILAFFGLFLSIVFSQGLFPRIVAFVYEFARSVIPFGYKFQLAEGEKLTKEKAASLHSFQVDRSVKLGHLQKSINCNTSVAMTVMVVAVTAISFKLVGLPISNIGIAWGLLLTICFVYLPYLIWSKIRDRDFWSELPAMSSSKFNLLLSIEAALLILYSALIARGALNQWLFIAIGLVIIYFSVRLHRIPHINVTHRRAKDFQENEEFYLTDIVKETTVVCSVFLVLAALNIWLFPHIKVSSIGLYIDQHPVRTFTVLFCFPFVVFLVRFLKVIGSKALFRFVFYVHRDDLPPPTA